MNTQTALQRRLMKEQALGQAIQSNKAMISNSLNNIGGDLIGYGMTKSLMNKGAGVNPTSTTGVPSASLSTTPRINPYFTNNMPRNFTSADIENDAENFRQGLINNPIGRNYNRSYNEYNVN
jgi:hypothetical protein